MWVLSNISSCSSVFIMIHLFADYVNRGAEDPLMDTGELKKKRSGAKKLEKGCEEQAICHWVLVLEVLI